MATGCGHLLSDAGLYLCIADNRDMAYKQEPYLDRRRVRTVQTRSIHRHDTLRTVQGTNQAYHRP